MSFLIELGSYWLNVVHFGSTQFNLVHFNPSAWFNQINLVHVGSFWIVLVLCGQPSTTWFISNKSVLTHMLTWFIGLFILVQPRLFLFDFVFKLVHFGSTRFNLVHLGSTWVNFVQPASFS